MPKIPQLLNPLLHHPHALIGDLHLWPVSRIKQSNSENTPKPNCRQSTPQTHCWHAQLPHMSFYIGFWILRDSLLARISLRINSGSWLDTTAKICPCTHAWFAMFLEKGSVVWGFVLFAFMLDYYIGASWCSSLIAEDVFKHTSFKTKAPTYIIHIGARWRPPKACAVLNWKNIILTLILYTIACIVNWNSCYRKLRMKWNELKWNKNDKIRYDMKWM